MIDFSKSNLKRGVVVIKESGFWVAYRGSKKSRMKKTQP